MSLLSWILGGREAVPERQLHQLYAQMLGGLAGCTPEEADQMVSEAIAACKKQGKAQGKYDLPEDYGDRIVEAARIGEPKSRRIVERARQEGASDDDIKEWWNLPDLSRRMVIWSENIFRMSVFRHARSVDGLSAEQAAARVHKMYPSYRNPGDTTKLSGENRPLPHELRGRVDAYKQHHGAAYIAQQVDGFLSYNAFVRHAIREGII